MLVAHAEQRRFQHVEVAVLHDLIEKLVEVGDQQVADVQPVHIRVGGEHDFLIAQSLDVVLDVQRAHEVIHLVVLVNDVALQVPDIERFALEGEHGLRVHVAATGDGPAGGLALADEDHRAPALPFGGVEMDLAVLQLRNAQRHGTCAFAGQFLDLLQFLPQRLGVLHLGENLIRHLLVAVEEMQQLLAHAVDQLGADFRVAQLVLRLRLEHRIFQPDGHSTDHAFADVVAVVTLARMLVHRLEQPLTEGAQVRAAVAGVLAVHKRVERLAITAVRVGEAKLQRLAGVMERTVDRLRFIRLQILHHQVQQAVPRLERLPVEHQLEPGVQVAVMPQTPLHKLRLEHAVLEDGRVRLEGHPGAVGLAGFALVLLFQPPLRKHAFHEFTVAMAADDELLRQRIHRLGADAVQTHAELEHVVVVFRAGVDLGHALDDLAQRNAPAVIADGDAVALDGDVHLLAEPHDVFVDGVVDDLLEQDVTAVVVVGAVADAPDIHARAQADVLDAGQRLDLALVVIVLR